LYAYLWPRLSEHADLKIYQPLSQRSHILVGLGRETKAHVRCCRSYRRNELCSGNLYKTLVGADCEAPFQFGEIQRVNGRTQYGLSILCQITHALAQFGSVWRCHQSSTRAHEQRVSSCHAKSR
jgi:hypothetical protein